MQKVQYYKVEYDYRPKTASLPGQTIFIFKSLKLPWYLTQGTSLGNLLMYTLGNLAKQNVRYKNNDPKIGGTNTNCNYIRT